MLNPVKTTILASQPPGICGILVEGRGAAGGIGKTRLAVALARELRPPVHLGQPLSYNLLISPETKSPLFAKNVEHRVLGEEDN